MNPYDKSLYKTVPIPEDSLAMEARGKVKPVVTYTLSARGKSADKPVFSFLRNQYGNIPLAEIESLFGFVERSRLYGGRMFVDRELSDRDVAQLNNAGIGIRIPMSNHYVTEKEYEESRPLLDRYHLPINSIIATNDDLARWIRRDYPRYTLDASVIKNIKTQRKIEEALDLYDAIVLPMPLNEDLEFLDKIRDKERIILFANAGCALTCPARICYPAISKYNKYGCGEMRCSQTVKERGRFGMVDFPLQPYIDIGITHFKLLRSRPNMMTGF